MAFKCEEMFNLISNQRKQPEGINASFINQLNKVSIHTKGYSRLVRMWQDELSHATDKSLNCCRPQKSNLLTGFRGLKINCILPHRNSSSGNMF